MILVGMEGRLTDRQWEVVECARHLTRAHAFYPSDRMIARELGITPNAVWRLRRRVEAKGRSFYDWVGLQLDLEPPCDDAADADGESDQLPGLPWSLVQVELDAVVWGHGQVVRWGAAKREKVTIPEGLATDNILVTLSTASFRNAYIQAGDVLLIEMAPRGTKRGLVLYTIARPLPTSVLGKLMIVRQGRAVNMSGRPRYARLPIGDPVGQVAAVVRLAARR